MRAAPSRVWLAQLSCSYEATFEVDRGESADLTSCYLRFPRHPLVQKEVSNAGPWSTRLCRGLDTVQRGLIRPVTLQFLISNYQVLFSTMAADPMKAAIAR